MRRSQNSIDNSAIVRRTTVGVALIFAFAILATLSITWTSAASLAGASNPERENPSTSSDRGAGRASRRSELTPAFRSSLSSPVAPIGTITVDRTDDAALASACTVAPNDCSLRGAVAFANLPPNLGTTINVPAGTYNLTIAGTGEGFNGDNSIGDLDITASGTVISGAGAASTIIHQTTSGDRVIEVNPFLDAGFITSISGVTISGGTETTGAGGGGIVSGSIDNVLTLTNCIISGNSATGAGTFGGGGVSHAGGTLNITGCTISGNSTSGSGGGLGYTAGDLLGRTPSVGTLTISGSTFSTNTAGSTAAGGAGADLFNINLGLGTYNIDSSTFSGNSATSGSGGAIIVESGGPLTVTTSAFTSNHAANSGGAINSGGNVASVRYSRLVGNTVTTPTNGLTLFRSAGVFSADDNWWGINTGPGANDFRSSSGSITPITFLKLQASASPNTICSGATSTINANIKQRNVGADLTVELNGLPAFPATIVNGTPAEGNLSGVSATFVDGSASATFTATGAGTANIDVTADNQTVTASIIVNSTTTSDPADQTVCEGGTATFTTTAGSAATFVWKKGPTVLNNGDLGGRVSITSGTDTSTLSISSVQASDADTYTVEASNSCGTATQSATLTVNATTTATTPADQAVCQGTDAHFSTTAGGTGPFHYAWTVDGSPFNGDSPSITVPTGSLSSGNHPVTVTVTGACGSVVRSANLAVGSNAINSIGPANVWIGVKTSDDVGTKFDLLAEVLRNNVVIGSGQINDVPGGSSGFNNAVQRTIAMALSGSGDFCSGGTLSFRLSVRIAASSGHVSGTARLWFNDSAANSRFDATIGGTPNTYYLLDAFVLSPAVGTGPKKTIDVLVNRNVGGNPFKPFGTWNITF